MKNVVVLFKGFPNVPKALHRFARISPMALLSLASPLRQAGFEVKIIDQTRSAAEHAQELETIFPRILFIGVSALTGPEIKHGLDFIDAVNGLYPNIPVVMGGWHASILPEQTLEDARIDVVVIGPGQQAVVELAKYYSKGSPALADIDNIVRKTAGEVKSTKRSVFRLEDYPPPALDLLDIDLYRGESLKRVIEKEIDGCEITGHIYYATSFGCPLKCGFCCNSQVYKNRWFGYDIEKVLDQLEFLNQRGVNLISFSDANLLFKADRVRALCEGILARGLKLFWNPQATVQDINRYERLGLFPLLKESGCFAISVGVESGDDEVLKGMNKRLTREQQLAAARVLAGHGIRGMYNFLFGMPKYESPSGSYKSLELAAQIKQIDPECYLPLSYFTPFPGNQGYDDCLEIGFSPPPTLEKWGDYEPEYESAGYFWYDKKTRRTIEEAFYYYLPFAFPGSQARGSVRNFKGKMEDGRWRWAFRFISTLASARVKRQLYGWGFEIGLYKMLARALYDEGKYR